MGTAGHCGPAVSPKFILPSRSSLNITVAHTILSISTFGHRVSSDSTGMKHASIDYGLLLFSHWRHREGDSAILGIIIVEITPFYRWCHLVVTLSSPRSTQVGSFLVDPEPRASCSGFCVYTFIAIELCLPCTWLI